MITCAVRRGQRGRIPSHPLSRQSLSGDGDGGGQQGLGALGVIYSLVLEGKEEPFRTEDKDKIHKYPGTVVQYLTEHAWLHSTSGQMFPSAAAVSHFNLQPHVTAAPSHDWMTGVPTASAVTA